MTVYIELFFFDNILINFYILYLTGKFQKLKTSPIPLFVSSLIGSIYGYYQAIGIRLLSMPTLKFVLSTIMIYIAFYKYPCHLIKLLFTFYGLSFLFGGSIFAMYFFTRNSGIVSGLFTINMPLRFLLIIIAIGNIAYSLINKNIKQIKTSMQGITIDIDNKTYTALSDFGNLCTYFNTPVIFINGNIFKIPPNINIVYIPYKTPKGTFIAKGYKTKVNVTFDIKKEITTYIAIIDTDFNGFDALINPEILL